MKDVFEISFDETTITVKEILYPVFKLMALFQGKPKTKIQTLKWNEVQEVYVFKRDTFAVDLICLVFKSSTNASIEINEEMKGWKHLIENLPSYLLNCLPFEEWFMVVAFPAFELNLIKIYPREK